MFAWSIHMYRRRSIITDVNDLLHDLVRKVRRTGSQTPDSVLPSIGEPYFSLNVERGSGAAHPTPSNALFNCKCWCATWGIVQICSLCTPHPAEAAHKWHLDKADEYILFAKGKKGKSPSNLESLKIGRSQIKLQRLQKKMRRLHFNLFFARHVSLYTSYLIPLTPSLAAV